MDHLLNRQPQLPPASQDKEEQDPEWSEEELPQFTVRPRGTDATKEPQYKEEEQDSEWYDDLPPPLVIRSNAQFKKAH